MKKKVLALILSITACLGVATGYNPYVYAESREQYTSRALRRNSINIYKYNENIIRA